jgi:hypothetical protein
MTTLAAAIPLDDVANKDNADKAGVPPTVSPADEPRSAPPTRCGPDAKLRNAKLCVPDPDYVTKLCGGIYPEVALGFFSKGTPCSAHTSPGTSRRGMHQGA